MNKNKKQFFLKAVFVAGAILGATNAFADRDGDHDDVIDTGIVEPCQYLPLVNNPTNSTVCVDVPVNLLKAKVVFNMDHDAKDASGTPIGMKHMIMLSTGLKARIAAGLVNPNDVSIIGVFHGSAASWVLSNEWWNNKNNNTEGNPYANLLNQLLAFKDLGVNVQLEECGVTMNGNHWTNDDLFPGIHVNQGAIGRLIALEQQKYSYIQPGK